MRWTISNILTLLRVALIPVIVALYLGGASGYLTAGVFLLAGVTDWADGFLARQLNEESPFGAFLDLVSHEPEKMRKAASYLASLSDGHLIAQADFLRLSDRVGFQSFHHPLIDSEGLLKVDGLTNPDLLNHQANQLAASD